jgi:hypothetical protein
MTAMVKPFVATLEWAWGVLGIGKLVSETGQAILETALYTFAWRTNAVMT